jgi:pantoate--beta-alanine ligase
MIPMLARTKLGLAAARASLSAPVVLVPTMGALHAGHRALLRRAAELAGQNGSVVVSVFVNPMQFGAGEDLDKYPRTLERDLAVCGEEGARLVFAPGPEQILPAKPTITISPGQPGQVLEGAFRPGFFDGVLTVVLKLFHLVGPDIAVFGEKDAQQLFLVRAMVTDLNMNVEIAAVETVREPDGLAMSSRNGYLSAAGRCTAVALSRALETGAGAADIGAKPETILASARDVLDAAAEADPPLSIDYLELVDPATFAALPQGYRGEALLLVAGRIGGTRLIDNVTVRIGGAP